MRNKVTGNSKGYKLKNCKKCDKKFRRLWKEMCFNCYRKKYPQMKEGVYFKYSFPCKDATKRIYDVKTHKMGKYFYGVLYLPTSLIGKKVKIKIVENEKEK